MKSKRLVIYEEQFLKIYIVVTRVGKVYSGSLYKRDNEEGKIRFKLNDEE